MSNRNTIPVSTQLFRSKLSKILDRLQRDKEKIPQQTQEAIVFEAVRLLTLFYKTIEGPTFTNNKAIARTSPSYQDYNDNLQSLKDDLDVLFVELESLESVVIQQFNLFASQSNRINSRIKRLSSQVTDYFLYSKLPIKNSLFFTDSFNDTSKIETLSKLLNAEQCEINQAEGIVTLPLNLDLTKNISINQSPLINSNSNGRNGNNEDIERTTLNDNLLSVFDNNSDTWFEYERVLLEDDGLPIILDFTINLNSEQIVNFIRINPNNFGNKTQVDIIDIQTSNDGKIYTSIKDDIPITGYLTEDEENIFKLAPSTSKFAGQGLFTFTPRFIKYVRIQLSQSSPYIIKTTQGQQFRYAIGIRDIELKQLAFLNTGEIISLPFEVNSEIKKVSIKASQSPVVDSELASIQHQISIDNGNSWLDIDPMLSDDIVVITNQPEILNFNLDVKDSVSSSTPIKIIRWKAILNRVDSAFNEASTSFSESILESFELKSVPLSEPWILTLDKNPIQDSVALLDLNFGSRGNTQVKYFVGLGTGKSIKFNLPWDNLDLNKSKLSSSDNIILKTSIARVFVAGQEWTRVSSISGGPTNKYYILNPDGTNGLNDFNFNSGPSLFNNGTTPPGSLTLFFGDNTNGLAPSLGDSIEIQFTDERIYPVDNTVHSSSILFPTGIDKSSVKIYRKGAIKQATVELKKGAMVHKLPHRNILNDVSIAPVPVFTNTDSVFVTNVPFKNGLRTANGGELTSNGYWSIDSDRGIIYSFKATEEEPGTVNYFYQEILEVNDWDWADDLPIHKSVKIGESDWNTEERSIDLQAGKLKINLPDFSVFKGSVIFEGLEEVDDADNPFLVEVPFIDGQSELTTTIKTEEKIPVLTPSPTIATFVTSINISSNENLNVSFDNFDVFVEEVSALIDVDSVGKYFIDRPTGTIHVHTNSLTIDKPGLVFYFTDDETKVADGSYSIDYENGEIYLQREVPAGDFICKYQYSEYYIRYNIARLVDPNHWSINGKELLIDSNETFIRSRLPNINGSNIIRPTTYQVNYKYIDKVRKNIADLKNYFTPILKEYALQIVTIDNL